MKSVRDINRETHGDPHEQSRGNSDFDSGRIPTELKQEFEDEYFQRSLEPQRRGAFGILLISLIFGILNLFLPAQSRMITLTVHYFVLCPLLAAIWASTFRGFYRRWSQYLMSFGVLLFAGTYIAFEYIAPTVPGSEASRTTVILILVVMVAPTLLYLRYTFAVTCCYLCFTVYAILSFTVFHLPEAAWNVGILLAACVLGNLIAALTDKYVRQDFLLRRALENERKKLATKIGDLDKLNYRLSEIAEARLQAAMAAEHEIGNGLAAIGLSIDVVQHAQRRGLEPSHYQVHLDNALRAVGELRRLLKMMLNIARLKAGYAPSLEPPEPVLLDEIVLEVCNHKRTELNLRRKASEQTGAQKILPVIRVEAGLSSHPVSLHRYEFRLVLENLLENAVKYSLNGGIITVHTRETSEDLIVSVTDQGIGVAPERLKDLFETIYERGRAEEYGVPGTGVGLRIIKGLVDAQGGHIWAESAGETQGTTFSLALPKTLD